MKVGLIGDGWGAISAYNALSKSFDMVYVKTNDADLLSMLRPNEIIHTMSEVQNFDLVICAGLKDILPPSLLGRGHIFNIHYSLLPKYRGLHSTVWAILNGEKEVGLTIHQMVEKIDAGAVLHQHAITYSGQTSTEIMTQCNSYIEKELGNILKNYISGTLTLSAQNESCATWVCKRNLDDCLIDFDASIENISLLFKALVKPYPLPSLIANNARYEVTSARFKESNYFMTNGRVVNIDNEGAWIKVNGGILIVQSIADSNNKNTDIGLAFKIGMRLKN